MLIGEVYTVSGVVRTCLMLRHAVASVNAINSWGSSTLCVCVCPCVVSASVMWMCFVCVLTCLYTYTYIRICCIDALVSFSIESCIPDVGITLKQNPMHIRG